jgi:uncharacterized membrane protein
MKAFLKRQTLSFYLYSVSFLLILLALILYFVNTKTAYFVTLHVSVALIVLGFAALLLTAGIITLANLQEKLPAKRAVSYLLDVLTVLLPCLLVASFFIEANNRIYSIVSIMTFQKSAQNIADMLSCFISCVLFLASAILAIISAFHSLPPEEKIKTGKEGVQP